MFRQSTISPLILISPNLSQQELVDSSLAINGMKLLRYAEQCGGIPLTQSLRAFHRKCVEWAAHEFRWPGFEPDVLYSVNKVLNEPDFPPLSILHEALQDLRLIRHYRGKAVLTKAGGSILGNHGVLQAFLTEWILAAPLQESLPPKAAALFWNLRHMLDVVSNRMGDWVTLGTFTEWALPVELFPGREPFGPRHEASFFIAYNFIRPLTWLGLLQDSPQNTPSLAVTHRQFRKSEIFDKVIKITLPNDIREIGVH